MHVILDSNIIISAFIYGGTPQEVLDTCVQEQTIQLIHSQDIVNECLQTIQKTRLQQAVKKANKNKKDFIEYFTNLSKCYSPSMNEQYCVRDKDDEHVLALAEQTQASYIVTGDKDLLVLKTIGTTQIVTAKQFLKLFN